MQPVSRMYVVIAALLLAPAASPQDLQPPSVDLSIHEFDFHARFVSSRTDEDVWLVRSQKYQSQVFRSSDAGRSWQVDKKAAKALEQPLIAGSSDNITLLKWLSPEVGIAAGYIGPRVLRTTDAGRSWQTVPLNDDLWVYDLEQSGQQVWLCGSSGRIFHSDDEGASWRELKGSPFNSDDRCMALSFLTPQSGWALGMKGSLWATEDAGTSWKRLDQPQLPQDGPHADLRKLVRLTPQVAWVQGSGGRFLTTDGGKTWHSRPITTDEEYTPLAVTQVPGGPRVITVGLTRESVPVEQWVPLVREDTQAVALGANTVLALRKARVSTHISGHLIRAGPPVSRGSGVLTPLEGFAQKSRDAWLGWTQNQIVASNDEGRTWFRVGRAPQSPVRAIAFLNENGVLAESNTGTLMLSENMGRTWALSTSPLDAYDFARASGHAIPSATPFDCVLTTSPSSMTVHFNSDGCFHSRKSLLSLKLSPSGAEVSGERFERKRKVRSQVELSREEGEFIIRTLIEEAIRPETGADCGSTTKYTVTLQWSCPSGSPQKGTVSFRASDCTVPPGFEKMFPDALNRYARAQGIYQFASEVFAVKGLAQQDTSAGR